MIKSEAIEALRQVAQEIASKEGCRLYDIEFVKGPTKTLRIYIDREDTQVGIDDCSNVSRELNLWLDANENLVDGQYDLEVSSPGLERRLTQAWHFEQSVGKKIKVRYRKDTDGKTGSVSSEAILQAFDGKHLQLVVGKNTIPVDLAAVEKAQLVFEMKKGQQKR